MSDKVKKIIGIIAAIILVLIIIGVISENSVKDLGTSHAFSFGEYKKDPSGFDSKYLNKN